MLEPHLHFDVEQLHRELREITLSRPRLDRPDYRRHGRLRARLRTFVLSPARVAGRAGASVPEVTIRIARATDSRDLARLAELSERRVPSGVVLVAEVESGIVAALPVQGGPVLTDLGPTVDVVQLLELRLEQLRAA